MDRVGSPWDSLLRAARPAAAAAVRRKEGRTVRRTIVPRQNRQIFSYRPRRRQKRRVVVDWLAVKTSDRRSGLWTSVDNDHRLCSPMHRLLYHDAAEPLLFNTLTNIITNAFVTTNPTFRAYAVMKKISEFGF